jgi:hypothetical protein
VRWTCDEEKGWGKNAYWILGHKILRKIDETENNDET